MGLLRSGAFRLFRLWGIDVHLHFSWFLVAFYSISTRIHSYSSPVWSALEYVALFVIVLTHEFGHALACRQVGGQADQILLWPFGGVAYVAPPSRPGATLWSIAAGPLVNVVLLPVLIGLLIVSGRLGWKVDYPDVHAFIRAVCAINISLLAFNLLPIYPLDGGQILRSLLWYPLGRARSLMIATVVGFIGGIALIGLAIRMESLWIGLITFFLLSNCWRSFKQAQVYRKMERLPRRPDFSCPSCHASPPIGTFWPCEKCAQPVDVFANSAVCPHCGVAQETVRCVDCGFISAPASWRPRDTVMI